jgi:hypothetical protein
MELVRNEAAKDISHNGVIGCWLEGLDVIDHVEQRSGADTGISPSIQAKMCAAEGGGCATGEATHRPRRPIGVERPLLLAETRISWLPTADGLRDLVCFAVRAL